MPSIDIVRGVAICGILSVNVISFGMGDDHLLNLHADTVATPLDQMLAYLGKIFATSKFVALFSLLFGAGIVIFTERAEAKGHPRPGLLMLWRGFLLYLVGLIHLAVWQGDILTVYALATPLLVLVRKWPLRLLGSLAALFLSAGVASFIVGQHHAGAGGEGLGWFWFADARIDPTVEGYTIAGLFACVIGMMLVGMVAYRSGFLAGSFSMRTYARIAVWGTAAGLVPSLAAVALLTTSGYDPDYALIVTAVNNVSTAPMACGYAAAIIWVTTRHHRGSALTASSRTDSSVTRGILERLRCAGQMALTNYLTQTMLGLVVLGAISDHVTITRTGAALYVLAVWALQLWWSKAWLTRFTQGPFEWLWRCATYRTITPIRRRVNGKNPASGREYSPSS